MCSPLPLPPFLHLFLSFLFAPSFPGFLTFISVFGLRCLLKSIKTTKTSVWVKMLICLLKSSGVILGSASSWSKTPWVASFFPFLYFTFCKVTSESRPVFKDYLFDSFHGKLGKAFAPEFILSHSQNGTWHKAEIIVIQGNGVCDSLRPRNFSLGSVPTPF